MKRFVPVPWALAVLLAGCATGGWGTATGGSGAGGFPVVTSRVACGEEALARGWPDLSGGSAALLAPFLACASPADYVALQGRVDMPRVVKALDVWSAMRLSALGPVRADAAESLLDARAAFLLEATERYGHVHAEVFTLFVLHSAHDDEVDALLRRLARDKQLTATLGPMPAVREELETRGMPLSAYPERAERVADVWRGLGRAARDALATSPALDGARYTELSARWSQLPEPYQRAAHEVEQALAWRHFAPEGVAVGSFDAMTFGVPLGFAYLVAGTGQGLASLSRREYEQATRELAPATLLVSLYAGGRGLRGLGTLKEWGARWEARWGAEGVRTLLRELRARREAAFLVAEGGPDAALALHEARGDVSRAQAWMSQEKSRRGSDGVQLTVERARGDARAGALGALVDEAAGLTREGVEARLAQVERDAGGPRWPAEVAVLEQQRASLETPPLGAGDNPRWLEYVAYRERRLGELKQGRRVEGPLRWEGYERMWGGFARGMAFERLMAERLRADAVLPRAARRFLGAFEKPRIERGVGVWKLESGLRFADVLVIEEAGPAGQPPRVETFSFKSRDFAQLETGSFFSQMKADARDALRYYGGMLDIRRPSLRVLVSQRREVAVQRVRLIYEHEMSRLESVKASKLKQALDMAGRSVLGVEVSFE